MRYETTILREHIGTLDLSLHCISNFEAAIDAMFLELEKRGSPELLEELCPYFGTLWPAGRMLANWVWQQGPHLAGRRVLELGCGLAVPSLVASLLQADVTASDLHPDVPEFLARNLAANPGTRVRYQSLDWRRVPPATLGRFAWVLASDVLYEKDPPQPLLHFLRQTLAPGGKAVLLDPNRSYWRRLVDTALGAGWDVHVLTQAPVLPGDPTQAVRLELSLSN